jgi:hypothetical protein
MARATSLTHGQPEAIREALGSARCNLSGLAHLSPLSASPTGADRCRLSPVDLYAACRQTPLVHHSCDGTAHTPGLTRLPAALHATIRPRRGGTPGHCDWR